MPEWNERVLTSDDFYDFSQREKVRIVESDLFRYKGEYYIRKNTSFILLQKNLKQPEKLWVGFHELGHHLLHYPVTHHFSKGIYRKMDREANYFAAISLMPTDLIKKETFGEIYEEFNYPKQLIELRKEIYDHYKI